MRKPLIPFAFAVLSIFLQSCYAELWVEEEPFLAASPLETQQFLESYDLWYVEIDQTEGPGEIPFLQGAFTLSFDRGTLWANNNLVGIGKEGNGLGIPVGSYAALPGAVEVVHEVDGFWEFQVYTDGTGRVELYDPRSDTSYYLRGYSRNTFDFDRLFYDNIHYFLQEYEAWEKTFVSGEGALTDFDAENYLQFRVGNAGDFFRSSVDAPGTALINLRWDYEGVYTVYAVAGDPFVKTLQLEYDFTGDDYFELYVVDDRTIELYHPRSETLYEFTGRGFREFLKTASTPKKRIPRELPLMQVERQRPE